MEGAGKMEIESGAGKDGEREREWWANGVTLSIWLRADVMERLRGDQALIAFAQ